MFWVETSPVLFTDWRTFLKMQCWLWDHTVWWEKWNKGMWHTGERCTYQQIQFSSSICNSHSSPLIWNVNILPDVYLCVWARTRAVVLLEVYTVYSENWQRWNTDCHKARQLNMAIIVIIAYIHKYDLHLLGVALWPPVVSLAAYQKLRESI